MRGEKVVFTTPPIVLRTPACRRSEPALNQYSRREMLDIFGENHEKLVSSRAFRWASFFPPGRSCVYEPQASRCWCAAYALCIRRSLPSTCFAQPVPFVRRHWLCWWLLRWSRHLHCFSWSFSNFWTRKTFQQIKLKHVDGRIFFGFMMMKQFRFTWVELIHGKECSYIGFFLWSHTARELRCRS